MNPLFTDPAWRDVVLLIGAVPVFMVLLCAAQIVALYVLALLPRSDARPDRRI